MKYKLSDISLPKWISTRTYLFKQPKGRTYIANERLHSFVQLDGLSSDLWYMLFNSSAIEFSEFIKNNNIENQLDAFIEELASQDLIIIKGNDENFSQKMIYIVFDKNKNGEDQNFIEEQNEWLRNHKFMPSLFLELTYRCNLKCVHCYNPKDIPNVEIPFGKVKEIIDDAYELGCYHLTISGGESTLYSHFIELVRYVREKRMQIEIFTNGQLLATNKNLYDELISLYPHQVCLSLYSTLKLNHEKVTAVNGSYENTIYVIEKLRKDNVLVQIKNFLLNINCGDCVFVKKYAESINANGITDLSLIPTIKGDKKTLEYIVREDDLFNLYSNPDSPLFIGDNPYLFDIQEHKNESMCLGGFNGLCISPTLETHVCVSLPLNLGNLNDVSLKQIWEDAVYHKNDSKLYQWLCITNNDLKECYKNDYCKFCHYCAGMGYLENGFLKKSDILCKQAKAKKKAYDYINNNK